MSSMFELQIAKFVEKAKGNVDLVVRRVALDLFKRVVIKSPVLTGRFKGNWQVQIGSVPAGTLLLTDPDGTATIAKVTAATLNLRAGQVIYLVNNLPYARKLEYGFSLKAPNGMVRITIQEWNSAVNKAAGEVKK